MAFSFGSTTAPTTTTTGFSLGGPPAKSPATGGFSFGTGPTVTTTQPSTGGFGFGTAATTTTPTVAPAFGGFGAAATTTSIAPIAGGFGAATTATTSVATFGGFGAATSTGTGTTAPAFGGFGAAATTAATAPTLGGFGAPTSTAPASTFGISSAAVSLPSSTPASGLVSGLGGSTTAPVVGLGGAQGGQPAVSQESKGEGPSAKESMIPQELFNTVEDLKKLIKEEKAVSSDVSHITDKQLKKVKEDTEALSQLVSVLSTGVQNNRAKLEQLKQLSGQELVNVEIGVRTRDTPPNMQYENVAPMEYFRRLVSQFEQSMVEYRQGIMSAEQHLQSVSTGCPITSGDIVTAVQKLHQALTDLAAKYQVVHTALSQQKFEFLSLQRQISDSSASSSMSTRFKPSSTLPATVAGPSPFLPPADPLTQARQTHLHSNQTLTGQGPPTHTLGPHTGVWGAGAPTATQFGTNTSSLPSNTSGFGASSTTFGATSGAFGSNTSGFGASSSGFGSSAFGASNTGVVCGTKRGKH